MTHLTGMTWEHARGFDPMVATAREYERTHPDVRITWEQRSLQAFADHPLDELAANTTSSSSTTAHGQRRADDGPRAAGPAGRDDELRRLEAQSLGPSFGTYESAGHVWALPIDAATQVACYRPDLLPRPPRTWDEVIELARPGGCCGREAGGRADELLHARGEPGHAMPQRRVAGELIAREDALAVLDACKRLARARPARVPFDEPDPDVRAALRRRPLRYCPLGYGYSNYSRPGYRERILKFADIPASATGPPGRAARRSAGRGSRLGAMRRPRGRDRLRVLGRVSRVPADDVFRRRGQPGNAAAWGDDRVNRAVRRLLPRTRAGRSISRTCARGMTGIWSFRTRGATR
jgi:multiple sugar transport system substrate-binding protein